MMAILQSIRIYPIKSIAPLHLDQCEVERRGLAGDRRMMLVDAAGSFISGRSHPQLTAISCEERAHGRWRVSAPEQSDLDLHPPGPDAPRQSVRVWSDDVTTQLFSDAVNQWFSQYLKTPVRLVAMDAQSHRSLEPGFGNADDEVSFADGYPLLLLSRAAVDALNGHLSAPVKAANFRPNLVISDCAAHAEDGWQRIRIGEVEFDLVKPCARCVFTTVDPDRNEKRTDGEPLRTLVKYRKQQGKVMFGQNVIARGAGRVCAGDSVEVIA